MTTKLASQRAMALYRNVHPLHLDTSNDRDTALEQAEARIKKLGVVATGDAIVLTVGEPMGQVGGTNTLKIVNVK
jgi:pyruvate kinase